MNTAEARALLLEVLAPYREWSYDQLCEMVGAPERTLELEGPSGARYQIEVSAAWDSKPAGDVRVTGCIDDGGWRAFRPLCEDFIKTPRRLVC